MNEGLLVARLVLGLLMTAHGAQKLFGWFGGYGLTGTAGFFEQIGFRPGRLFATAAALGEVVSGLLVTLGFLGPVGPALMISVMIVANGNAKLARNLDARCIEIRLEVAIVPLPVCQALCKDFPPDTRFCRPAPGRACAQFPSITRISRSRSISRSTGSRGAKMRSFTASMDGLRRSNSRSPFFVR